jgi:hypothetical protein
MLMGNVRTVKDEFEYLQTGYWDWYNLFLTTRYPMKQDYRVKQKISKDSAEFQRWLWIFLASLNLC